MNWLSGWEIILGSASPRRFELLEKAGIDFVQRAISIEEIYPDELDTHQIAEYLAKLKATPHVLHPNTILITADSIVLLGDEVLGKPKDTDQAIDYLTRLSGKTHRVDTGVCLTSTENQVSFTVSSMVRLGELTTQEINFYIEEYRPFDKAGSYGIQDWLGICKVEEIVGSYSNIMGLPMYELYHALHDFCSEGETRILS